MDENASQKFRWLRVSWKCGRFAFNLRFNPVVTFLSAAIIWFFVIWCSVQADVALVEMTKWMKWITHTCTWMYIGTQDAWAVFIIVLYFSKYGKMKLGKPDDKPDFSDATYFTMLFAAGIGVGLFYFGVGMFLFYLFVLRLKLVYQKVKNFARLFRDIFSVRSKRFCMLYFEE